MNEGKPTKAKWWNRPRPHGTGPDTPPAPPANPDPGPDPESPAAEPAAERGDTAERPGLSETVPAQSRPAVQRAEAGEGATHGDAHPPAPCETDSGDYELARPAADSGPAPDSTAHDSGPAPDSTATDPAPDPARTDTNPVPDSAPIDRDSVPDSAPAYPGPARESAPADTGSAPRSDLGGALDSDARSDRPSRGVEAVEAVDGAPEEPSGAAPGAPHGPRPDGSAPTVDGTGLREDGDYELARPAVARPEPLHGSDPYSTPPYGHPGPWAPAPPVQHPTAPHAQGPDLSAAIPAQARTSPLDPVPQDVTSPASEGPSDPQPPEEAVPDPWRNYDPWAAPAPLQQSGGAVPTVTQRRRRTRRTLVLGAVVLALVSGGVGGVVGAYLQRNEGVTKIELPQAAEEAPGRPSDSVAGIAAHALPSVVTLHVKGSEEEGTGTGFVLDGRGHILTNNHVIEPAGDSGEISVTFSGGETAKAKLVGHDSGYDLAVVKVTGVSGLTPMPLGNSDSVQVGDPVVAIGAPFDLANTVTSGIISAKERPITAGGEKGDGTDVSYVDALQTDAPINPGNSGGPLLDSRARVIGINSAIRSADNGSDLESGQAGSIGLGFAIPVNQAKRVAEELINTGRATHPVIGVTLDMNYTGDGARVGAKAADGGPAVSPRGPGAEAGVKAGDVITEVDGTRVHSGEELIVRTRAHRPGDHLRLTLRRGGTERTVTLVLGSADGD
ncbi:trypsin-like peptidase domain-containing protein [Streptomyces sp. Midd1]|uniref:trypsin-like peptidase domain-containing protein n=1 Tax=Streptomyces sp. Midd3 TaxID=3161191 RepID=UPI0034DAE565